MARQSERRLGRCVVSGTGDNATYSSWAQANLGSTVRQVRTSVRRVNAVGILIASTCGIALISLLVLLPRTANLSGNFWLATLWLTWLVSLTWALTRPSLLAAHDYQAGVIPALKISALAQAAMLVGAIGTRTLLPVRDFDRIDINLSADRLDKAAVAAVTFALAGVIGMSVIGGVNLRDFFVYTTSGGYGTFWSELHANLGFLVTVQCVGGLAIVLLPLQLSAACSRRRGLSIAAAILGSLILLGGGQRGPFITAVSAAELVWLKTSKKRRRQRKAVMLGALVLLLISGFVGVARAAAGSREVTFGNVMGEPFGAGNNLFLPVAGLATTVPTEIPYLHGDSYLQVFELPISRALWPTKLVDDITTIITRFDPEDSGLAFPAFGEGYANFGFIGVALSGVLLGGAAELLHRRFASSQDLKTSVVAAVEAAVFLQLFSRGDFAPMLTTYVGILVAAGCIGRRRSAVLDPVAISWRPQTRQGDGAQSTTPAATRSSIDA